MRTPITIAVACLALACTVDASTCVKSHKVVAGDTCISIAKKSSISASKLISLNPSINSKCSNLRKGSTVCVKKSSANVKAATKTTKKTTTKKTTKKTTTKKTTKKTTTKKTTKKTTTKKTTTKKTTTKKTTTKKATTTTKKTTTSTKKTTTKANTTTTTKPTTTKPNTTTNTNIPTSTPSLTYNYGLTAAVNSKSDFCVFLPSSPGGTAENNGKIDIDAIANSEKSAVAFCLKPTANAAGARTLPIGFITTSHYYKNTTAQYVQVTGKINPARYSLSPLDQGGQYDNHGKGSPPLSMCYGYKYYVNLIEPDRGTYCMRCCNTYSDCNAGRSAYGCARVVQDGNYD